MAAEAGTRWSDDAFLDTLRLEGDAAADECLVQLKAVGQDFSELFRFLNSNVLKLPDGTPEPLRGFFTDWAQIPSVDGQPLDRARLRRGEDIFLTHAGTAAMVLLAMSLPAGYAAPNLARVLVLSGNLENHPYKRLLGVLQMVVNVTAPGGFEPIGKAVITAAKLRLLHAGVRRFVRRRVPDYEPQYGVPVNHEDMLATIMGFSLLVVRGMQELGVGLADRDAEDYYYLWRVFAVAMGIHPRDAPWTSDYIPATLGEADEFYAAYARRHYRTAEENPEGVELTRANLLMLEQLADDTPLRHVGARLVPRIYMQQLLGASGLRQRGVKPVWFHPLASALLVTLMQLWSRLGTRVDSRTAGRHVHEFLSQFFFRALIERTLHREVTFNIPEDLEDLHALTENIVRPHGERRQSQRRGDQISIAFPERRGGTDRRQAIREKYWGTGPGR